MVAPGQQAGPGRRAQRRHVQVVVAQALLRQPIDRRRFDRGAVAAEAGEADVVEEHHHHIGRVLGGLAAGGHQGSDSFQVLPMLPLKR